MSSVPPAGQPFADWIGFRLDGPTTVGLTIRPALLNRHGRLAGAVTFTLVDKGMSAALAPHLTGDEICATLNISINYFRTATEGDVVCRSQLDRRTRTTASLRSEVVDDAGELLATAVGTYAILPRSR